MPHFVIDLHPLADVSSLNEDAIGKICLMKDYQLFRVAHFGESKDASYNPGKYPACLFLGWHEEGYKANVILGKDIYKQ